jgi:hypothetical protein
MSTSTYDAISRLIDGDPWRPRENLHPLTGRRVRYMGTEWAWQGTLTSENRPQSIWRRMLRSASNHHAG